MGNEGKINYHSSRIVQKFNWIPTFHAGINMETNSFSVSRLPCSSAAKEFKGKVSHEFINVKSSVMSKRKVNLIPDVNKHYHTPNAEVPQRPAGWAGGW